MKLPTEIIKTILNYLTKCDKCKILTVSENKCYECESIFCSKCVLQTCDYCEETCCNDCRKYYSILSETYCEDCNIHELCSNNCGVLINTENCEKCDECSYKTCYKCSWTITEYQEYNANLCPGCL